MIKLQFSQSSTGLVIITCDGCGIVYCERVPRAEVPDVITHWKQGGGTITNNPDYDHRNNRPYYHHCLQCSALPQPDNGSSQIDTGDKKSA